MIQDCTTTLCGPRSVTTGHGPTRIAPFLLRAKARKLDAARKTSVNAVLAHELMSMVVNRDNSGLDKRLRPCLDKKL